MPRRSSSNATSHPVSSNPCLESSEKTSTLSSSLPKCVPPTRNPELEQRDKSTSAALKSSNKRTELDSLQNCKVTLKKLQPSQSNLFLSKNDPTVKKDNLRRNRDREISFALSKELNENLRVNATIHFFSMHFKVIYISNNALMLGFPKFGSVGHF